MIDKKYNKIVKKINGYNFNTNESKILMYGSRNNYRKISLQRKIIYGKLIYLLLNKTINLENIDNIEIGKPYKSYKEVCECLDIKYTGGKVKDLKLKELSRYFKYHNVKSKYFFDEKYDVPLEKIDNRVNNKGSNNNKYTELDDIIVEALLKQREKYIKGSFTKIFCDYIPMFTEEYMYFHRTNIKELRKKFNYASAALIKLYHTLMRNKVNSSFNSALNRLQKQGLIQWEEIYIVLANNKRITVTKENELFQKIKDTQKEICNEMEMDYYKVFENESNIKIFNKKLDEKLHIQEYYKNYHIELLDKNIECPKTNIFQLKKKYISSMHKYIVNKEVKNEFDEIFYPYKIEVNIKSIILMDSYFWQGKEYIDLDNKEMLIGYKEQFNKLFGAEDNSDIEEIQNVKIKEDIDFDEEIAFTDDEEEWIPF